MCTKLMHTSNRKQFKNYRNNHAVVLFYRPTTSEKGNHKDNDTDNNQNNRSWLKTGINEIRVVIVCPMDNRSNS